MVHTYIYKFCSHQPLKFLREPLGDSRQYQRKRQVGTRLAVCRCRQRCPGRGSTADAGRREAPMGAPAPDVRQRGPRRGEGEQGHRCASQRRRPIAPLSFVYIPCPARSLPIPQDSRGGRRGG